MQTGVYIRHIQVLLEHSRLKTIEKYSYFQLQYYCDKAQLYRLNEYAIGKRMEIDRCFYEHAHINIRMFVLICTGAGMMWLGDIRVIERLYNMRRNIL